MLFVFSFYIDPAKLSADVKRHLELENAASNCGLELRPYQEIRSDLQQLVDTAVSKGKIWVSIKFFYMTFVNAYFIFVNHSDSFSINGTFQLNRELDD